MPSNLLRFAYVCEFLLAIIAIFTAWPEVGGVAVLDIMPWSVKLALGTGLAVCLVGFTASIVRSERLVSWRSTLWFVAAAALLIGIGVVTYYYMLEQESEESDEPTATAVEFHSPRLPAVGLNSLNESR